MPDPPAVSPPGKINAWDNKEFVDAVEKSGKQLIVAGVSTEVCVAFVALSAVKDGYDVFAVRRFWNLEQTRARGSDCSDVAGRTCADHLGCAGCRIAA